MVYCPLLYLGGDRALAVSARALIHTTSCIRKRKMSYLNIREKKRYVQVQVQICLKALCFIIFDPHQLTYLESVICSLLLAAGRMEFCY